MAYLPSDADMLEAAKYRLTLEEAAAARAMNVSMERYAARKSERAAPSKSEVERQRAHIETEMLRSGTLSESQRVELSERLLRLLSSE